MAIAIICLFVGVSVAPSITGKNCDVSDSETIVMKSLNDGPTIEWDKTFEGVAYGSESIQQTNDEGYIIAGTKYMGTSDDYDVWLIKTDRYGNKDWEKTFGGVESDAGWCVQQTSDGGYIITGRTMSYGAGEGDVWMIKTDTSGNLEWKKPLAM